MTKPMAQWIRVCNAAQLADDGMTAVSVAGKHLIVYGTSGQYFVTDRRCTHQGADLLRGYFDGDVIECPVHQGRFNVRTGCALSAPASTALRTYPVKITDNDVYVEID
jgi:nitrite reductase/ring-hydroxylating ferredoxin subunit